MEILDFFRRQKESQKDSETKPETGLSRSNFNDEKVNVILEEEIKEFFPSEGTWLSHCFKQPDEISYDNLPCHLRDNSWMSNLLQNVLYNKGVYIPQHTIKKFMNNSEEFTNLRHEYELRIVKWEINWISKGGENWLPPNGEDELSMLFSEDIDKIIRGGVVRTLKAIGMNGEIIEEGLEKYADTWRPAAMSMGFIHKYEPFTFTKGTPESADAKHKQNWLANREYEYYQEHKRSVDNYGTKTPAMQMTPEEHSQLVRELAKQNYARCKYLEQWKETTSRNQLEHTKDI